jgi:glyoxalase family protein
MPADVPGLHHVTAIASDPGRNLAFYTETLGLRLVKRSVNQDDVSVYHLFYGDYSGTPGTSMTFFPYEDARPGRVGTGQVSTVAFLIPGESVEYWVERLESAGTDVDDPSERFGDSVIPFRDPDGERHRQRFESSGVPVSEANGGSSDEGNESDSKLGYVVDVLEDPQAPRGRPGASTVHHVAFQVTDDDQPAWRDVLMDHGLRPTEITDRKWFRSVYARTKGGVLFEYATKSPGYTVDEDLDELGERLVLPELLEDRRDDIEAGLPELS